MDEVVVRVAVVGAVALAAVGVGWWLRRGAVRRAERGSIDVSGFGGGQVLLFTDTTCSSCDAARDALERTGVDYVEISYGKHPDGMREAGITAVPVIVVRDDDGRQVGVMAGPPRSRRLRRLLGRAGLSSG